MNHSHGMTGTVVHKRWKSMRVRCTPTYRHRHRYADRGIAVCREWDDFAVFYADMGDPPEDTQLDRIDNDGPYCKANCRWVDQKTNVRNGARAILNAAEVSVIKTMSVMI